MKRTQRNISDFFSKKNKVEVDLTDSDRSAPHSSEPSPLTSLSTQASSNGTSSQSTTTAQKFKVSTRLTPSISQTSSTAEQSKSLSINPLECPVQPNIDFPKTNGRRFTARYYDIHEWIEYSKAEDAVYCFPCRHFNAQYSVRPGEAAGSRTFIDKGFRKWKDASALLKQHELGERHKASMTSWAEFKSRSSQQKSVSSLLDSQRSGNIEENRKHIKVLLKATGFLGRQGLAFRGHDESENSQNRGNFLELLNTMTEDDPDIKDKLNRRYGHYCSPEYQNDLIDVYSARLLKSIITKAKQAKYFSIMADETKDMSKSELLAILIRYVDAEETKINERAIGLHHLKDCSAESIANAITSMLSDQGLDIKHCVGQCYDGANVMRGWVSGVQARIKDLAPHATYFHCHAHRLNLVLVHVLGNDEEVKDFFSTVQTLYHFISNSATRHELFVEIQQRMNKPVLNLERTVPTRWFYWFNAVMKVLKTYQAILGVLDEGKKDRAESIGIKAQIMQENFIFLLCTMEKILGITYCLSQQLQAEELDLAAAVHLIKSTEEELKKSKTDATYLEVLEKAKSLAASSGIVWGEQKRTKTVPHRFADSVIMSTIGKKDTETKGMYFKIVDSILMEYNRRFSGNEGLFSATDGFKKENTAFMTEEKFQPLIENYESFLNGELLQLQLPLARNHLRSCDGDSVLSLLESLRVLPVAYSEVIKLLQIFATLPITTAGNERIFSVLKRVKGYLRSSTGDERLSSLMLMAIEREEMKKIPLDQLVDDFAARKPRRYPLLH